MRLVGASLVTQPIRCRRLPVRDIQWFPERRAECQERYRSPITIKGHNAGVKPPNYGKRYPATPPSTKEMLAILDAAWNPALEKPHKRGVRNRALLATLWRSGLRVSEALALLPHEIDFHNQTVTVMCGKGKKRRVSGIDKGALLEISRWTMFRATLSIPEGSPLFCTVNRPTAGNPVHPAYVRELCRELRVKTKIPHRVAPHQLRHAHACELAREKTPIHLIQRQLGHSSLGTTATYLQSISSEEVVEAIAKREWGAA